MLRVSTGVLRVHGFLVPRNRIRAQYLLDRSSSSPVSCMLNVSSSYCFASVSLLINQVEPLRGVDLRNPSCRARFCRIGRSFLSRKTGQVRLIKFPYFDIL